LRRTYCYDNRLLGAVVAVVSLFLYVGWDRTWGRGVFISVYCVSLFFKSQGDLCLGLFELDFKIGGGLMEGVETL